MQIQQALIAGQRIHIAKALDGGCNPLSCWVLHPFVTPAMHHAIPALNSV